jgi:hypothetical protein
MSGARSNSRTTYFGATGECGRVGGGAVTGLRWAAGGHRKELELAQEKEKCIPQDLLKTIQANKAEHQAELWEGEKQRAESIRC